MDAALHKPKLRWWQFKRRWFRISLRTFLVLLTVACIWLGWLANRASQRRHAVEWVMESSGSVRYDYELAQNRRFPGDAEPPGPDLLRNLFGIGYFANHVDVSFNNTQVSDLTPLANLSNLETLWLSRTRVSKEACEMPQKSLPLLSIDSD
ncbi:MAG: hypothetical protein ACI9HK_003207 [Pirellulaceae bacterium]|jgi:hypothetical protein